MIYHRTKIHQSVECHQFGYSLIKKKPLMTVFCYLLDGLLIDTAQNRCEKRVLEVFKTKNIQQIALTHWHEDHIGNTTALVNAHQSTVFAHPYTSEKLKTGYDILPYEKYLFGNVPTYLGEVKQFPERIETEKHQLLPIFTPGHSDDHTVFLEAQEGWIFSGDLFVSPVIKVFRNGENFWEQVESLKKILKYDFDTLFCGHNPQFKNGKELMKKKLNYFEDLGGNVLKLHEKGFSAKEIMSALRLPEKWLARILTSNDGGVLFLVEAIIKPKV